ncbi:cytochrome c3 family protein [Desulfurivibrio sp. C05AmB]|uniref:cytochrome c3 family protein n=1 Tax=Desulfurivibrio sp. C05AmB TaxID=3374371 RepID=UPI00376F2849
MKWLQMLLVGLVLGVPTIVLGISDGLPHRFTLEECLLCHTDGEGGKESLRWDITAACTTCHPPARKRSYQSHPTDIFPRITLPREIPLEDGFFTCISCHDVHAERDSPDGPGHFLRRIVEGKHFCLSCHELDDEDHIFLGATHGGQFQVNKADTRIDPITLLCLECHDDRIAALDVKVAAKTWNNFSCRLNNHPIGISYRETFNKRPRNFIPPEALGDKIELFADRIGCGTCHNRFSGEPFMLSRNNLRSALCLSCHVK